ncbi:MAG: alpha-L-arabinofuranosidase C-terminal domain-containing protein [Thermodesulfobacteriota bacterium]
MGKKTGLAWSWALAFLLLFFLPAMAAPQTPVGHRYRCEVDAGQVTGTVCRELFGTNVEWFNNGGGLTDAAGRVDGDLTRLAMEQGVSVVRFPGGTLSDFYHWENGIGPVSKRPVSPHHTDPGSSKNNFGSPELIRFCRQTGAHPLITVNAGTGTPEEAAAWVAYMNAPRHAARTADGFPDPVGVRIWEVGNELYLDGTGAEKAIALTPDRYAERFLAYAEKMRAADPSIELAAIGVAGSYTVPFGPHGNWNRVVLSKAGGRIDYLSVHNAYFPVLYEQKTFDEKAVYQSLWGSALAVERDLRQIGALMKIYCKGENTGIAVTEWGPLFSFFDPAWRDHTGTMGAAVYVARLFQVFMSNPMVRAAAYFKYTGSDFMAWVDARKTPRTPYYVVKMYANHFGTRLVKSTIETPVFDTGKIGFARAEKNVPVLSVISALDASGNRLFVNIVSCSWDRALKVDLNVRGFDGPWKIPAVARVLSASSPTAGAGAGTPGGEAPTGIQTLPVDPGRGIVIPPASVVIIEITKDNGQT